RCARDARRLVEFRSDDVPLGASQQIQHGRVACVHWFSRGAVNTAAKSMNFGTLPCGRGALRGAAIALTKGGVDGYGREWLGSGFWGKLLNANGRFAVALAGP